MRKYNNINITEISRDMCYVLTTIKSVLMFRIQARSAEYSRTLVTFNSSFSFEMISPTSSIIQVHFRCIPFREMFFSISWLVLAVLAVLATSNRPFALTSQILRLSSRCSLTISVRVQKPHTAPELAILIQNYYKLLKNLLCLQKLYYA